MLNLNSDIYTPEKLSIIKSMVLENIVLELGILLLVVLTLRFNKRLLSTALILALVLELFIFSAGNLLTTHTSNLNYQMIPIKFGSSRYISTADTIDYTGPQVYWNHLRVRHPFAPDLTDEELVSFSRLKQELSMLPANTNVGKQLYNASGYSAVVLSSFAKFWDSQTVNSVNISNLSDRRLQTLGVNYIITGFPEDFVEQTDQWQKISDEPTIYKTSKHNPRVFFLGGGTAKITSHQPNELAISTSTTSPSNLLVTDSIYPGWHATIDDKPAEIKQFEFAFRQVEVPKGDHIIKFSYKPTSVKIGLVISAIGVITASALFLWPNQKLLSSS